MLKFSEYKLFEQITDTVEAPDAVKNPVAQQSSVQQGVAPDPNDDFKEWKKILNRVYKYKERIGKTKMNTTISPSGSTNSKMDIDVDVSFEIQSISDESGKIYKFLYYNTNKKYIPFYKIESDNKKINNNNYIFINDADFKIYTMILKLMRNCHDQISSANIKPTTTQQTGQQTTPKLDNPEQTGDVANSGITLTSDSKIFNFKNFMIINELATTDNFDKSVVSFIMTSIAYKNYLSKAAYALKDSLDEEYKNEINKLMGNKTSLDQQLTNSLYEFIKSKYNYISKETRDGVFNKLTPPSFDSVKPMKDKDSLTKKYRIQKYNPNNRSYYELIINPENKPSLKTNDIIKIVGINNENGNTLKEITKIKIYSIKKIEKQTN